MTNVKCSHVSSRSINRQRRFLKVSILQILAQLPTAQCWKLTRWLALYTSLMQLSTEKDSDKPPELPQWIMVGNAYTYAYMYIVPDW